MDAGRKALHERGVTEAGPYQSPMEDGMQHFHEWYRRIMAETDPASLTKTRPWPTEKGVLNPGAFFGLFLPPVSPFPAAVKGR